MRLRLLLAFFLVASLQAVCQGTTATPPTTTLPKDPRAILEAARPFYDFSNPLLKPWHLRATYRLFDDKGNPAEQGTFEFWWASPKSYRSTWTRADAVHTDWHTSDGKHAYADSGRGFDFFEYKLQSALLDPLPETKDLDLTKVRLERQELKSGNSKLPCVMVVPIMPQHGQIQIVPLGLFPTYCFDPHSPILRAVSSFGSITEGLNDVAKVQGCFLPRVIELYDGNRKSLTAKVELVEGIRANDPALTPDASAIHPNVDDVKVPAKVMNGMLIKKQPPIYPQDAKDARVSGTVVLDATIGRDGRIHNLHVVQAPWPSLVAASLFAVSKWEYKPYLLNGEPVEVDTTINVIFTLGG